uniref:Suppressor of fused homolog n=2 Tax=Hirondellea gigas TaxID=1518452 RepID=A0A2P2HXG0_9CRUS
MDKEEMDWKEGKSQSSNGSVTQKTDNVGIRETTKSGGSLTEGGIPLGLEALFSACRRLYPEQPNPLQVTALVKYWLGGPDPLDYISMYEVPGNLKLNIPPHWHYISFGLSDIHGDGRVHEFVGPGQPSGFGFELTMRLKREPTDKAPPTWPAALMQSLAKYVFQSESVLCVGDHVSWHSPLDGSESRLQHMLMAEDSKLGSVATPNGNMQFVQVVGITSDELRAVQHWNGAGVLDIMKRSLVTGGPLLVTDLRRGESIYEADPGVAEEIEAGIEAHGSNLSGVSAKIAWSATQPHMQCAGGGSNGDVNSDTAERVSSLESEQIKIMLKKGLMTATSLPSAASDPASAQESSCQAEKASDACGAVSEKCQAEPVELSVVTRLDSLHITINLESGALLPLALRGRLKHDRHFTFKSVTGPAALTLVAAGVSGAFVSPESPYGLRGPWLQVLIPPDLLDKMSDDLSALADPDEVKVPAQFSWPSHKLTITVHAEE